MVLKPVKPTDPNGVTIEAWSQGWMVGALIIMACVTLANMRRKILLHKLILIELIIGMPVGTFIFTPNSVYHWYLSVTAMFVFVSWTMHNVIAWMKNKPFLSRKASRFYIWTVVIAQAFWVWEITVVFMYFGGINVLFTHSRPFEPLFRDPWWVFTVCNLFWNIKTKYEFGIVELIRVSPRFGILLGAMLMSVAFMIVDICSVTHAIPSHGLPDGINPFWKFSYIFKCLTDTIVLDDFKTALDRLAQYKMERSGSIFSDGIRGSFNDPDDDQEKKYDTQRSHSNDIRSPSDWFGLQGIQSGRSEQKARQWTDLNELAMVDVVDIERAAHIDDIRHPNRASIAHTQRSRRDSVTYVPVG